LALLHKKWLLGKYLTAMRNLLRNIRKLGRKNWKKQSGYHKHSFVETVIYRFKSTFGLMLRSRDFNAQANEAFTKCNILNKLSQLGLSNSVKM